MGCFLSKIGFKEAIGDSLSESRLDNEWVEQDEPGVYITLTSVPGGAKDLKRVRFRYIIFNAVFLLFKIICNIFLVIKMSKLIHLVI